MSLTRGSMRINAARTTLIIDKRLKRGSRDWLNSKPLVSGVLPPASRERGLVVEGEVVEASSGCYVSNRVL